MYVGNDNDEIKKFFGKEGFSIDCFLLKKDLLKYLDETQTEYLKPEQPYIHKTVLPDLWSSRKEKIDKLPDKIKFQVVQVLVEGPRIYVKSESTEYKLIRELSLPNITYISILKLFNKNKNLEYYFRLFADYFGSVEHPYLIQKEKEEIENIVDEVKKATYSKARIGQGKYREKLLKSCPYCPITMVSDDRILIASHIKPWAKSNETEKIDPLNGFMLTPTFDFLFDRGFMSFTNDKKTILSPFLSKMTYSKIGISDNKTFPFLPIDGREDYLEYHRQEILKK